MDKQEIDLSGRHDLTFKYSKTFSRYDEKDLVSSILNAELSQEHNLLGDRRKLAIEVIKHDYQNKQNRYYFAIMNRYQTLLDGVLGIKYSASAKRKRFNKLDDVYIDYDNGL